MAADRAFIDAVRAALAPHADLGQAPSMQAYMKSTMPYLGIATPLRRRLVAGVVAGRPQRDAAGLAHTMRALWRSATHREERYVAMELARVGPHRRLIDLRLLPVYEEMIASGAWWDYCDDISGQGLGALLQRHGAELKPTLRAWSSGDDLWLRRAAMLAQRGLKQGFDAELLYDTILPSLDDPRFKGEFFIRKGMGWALRERSYAAPDEVRAFCREYAGQLSPLTVREALKALRRRAPTGDMAC